MKDKLRELVAQASIRVDAADAEREAEMAQKQKKEFERDAEIFKRKVETVLGEEVLNAIGPVTFHENFLRNSMTFDQDSRTFRLQQETGHLVQLEENGRWLEHQFNLDSADSRDTFLHTLGTALKSKSGT